MANSYNNVYEYTNAFLRDKLMNDVFCILFDKYNLKADRNIRGNISIEIRQFKDVIRDEITNQVHYK